MKRHIVFLCLILSFFQAYAYKLEIIKLNTPTIKIGNKVCSKGSTFEDTDIIYWSSPKQDMWVKVLSTSNRGLKHFTRETFLSRKSRTASDYFRKINHPSVRADEMALSVGKNKDKFDDKRIALVIGNSNYEFLSTLNNPINDCADISEKLVSLGFDVYSLYDVNYRDFETALKKFSGNARDYDVALVYYSGHGIEYNGHNYLIPIEVNLSNEDDLFNCIELDDVYTRLNRTKCHTKLVFFDACRTEPNWKHSISNESERPVEVYTVYSTAPNAFSFDGDERNSPFTAAFLKYVEKPYDSVISMVNDMGIDVKATTNLAQKVNVGGEVGTPFTFVDKIISPTVIDYSVLNISELENLANSGDVNAYIPIAKYYLKNAFGITDYDIAYQYALRAYQNNDSKSDAVSIFNMLDSLGYFNVSENQNPLK